MGVVAARQVNHRDPTNSRTQKDVIRQVANLIVEHKVQLWRFFFKSDIDKSGFVALDIWLAGCTAVLGDFPWEQLSKLFVKVDRSAGIPRVDYVAFLQRFRVG